MKCVKLFGRLGNQMFQTAFAIAWAKYTGSRVFLDWRYCDQSIFDWFKIPNQCLSKTNKPIHALSKWFPKQEVLHESPIQSAFEHWGFIVYLEGYFQNELFFKPYETAIREVFVFGEEEQKSFNEKFWLSLATPYQAIHIRRTDYLEHGDIALPMEFYESFLGSSQSALPTVFISDDIEFVRSHFGNNPQYRYHQNSAKEDFMLLQNASQLVISNSTFAWWAAYLRKDPTAPVFAPMNWMGYNCGVEKPMGFMSDQFNWIH